MSRGGGLGGALDQCGGRTEKGFLARASDLGRGCPFLGGARHSGLSFLCGVFRLSTFLPMFGGALCCAEASQRAPDSRHAVNVVGAE